MTPNQKLDVIIEILETRLPLPAKKESMSVEEAERLQE